MNFNKTNNGAKSNFQNIDFDETLESDPTKAHQRTTTSVNITIAGAPHYNHMSRS